MKTIEFNLERALNIQNNEEKGKIQNRFGYPARIIFTESKNSNFPIIALITVDGEEVPHSYTEEGQFLESGTTDDDLVLLIPDPEVDKELKPFDKVLVRDYHGDTWIANLFSHWYISTKGERYAVCAQGTWRQCLPFNKNTEYLIGTAKPY